MWSDGVNGVHQCDCWPHCWVCYTLRWLAVESLCFWTEAVTGSLPIFWTNNGLIEQNHQNYFINSTSLDFTIPSQLNKQTAKLLQCNWSITPTKRVKSHQLTICNLLWLQWWLSEGLLNCLGSRSPTLFYFAVILTCSRTSLIRTPKGQSEVSV